jgi:hypothetical protein
MGSRSSTKLQPNGDFTHSLVGYDRLYDRVAEEFDVPDAVLPKAKELARVPPTTPMR